MYAESKDYYLNLATANILLVNKSCRMYGNCAVADLGGANAPPLAASKVFLHT